MKKWMWYVIGALVLALAGGGVLYGVLTHEEPGLMKVCWAGGQAHYDGACQELEWKRGKLPIPYYIGFGENHKDYVGSVVKGAELWNTEIGPVFKQVDKAEDALVKVTWGSIGVGKHCSAGSTSHTGSAEEGATGAEVVLRNPSDVHAVYRYAAHEFGHVLGLAHDEAPRSIMYPTQPDVTEDMTFVLPSDSDEKLLKEKYFK